MAKIKPNHSMTEALEGKMPQDATTARGGGHAGPPGQSSTPEEIAEEARRAEEARPNDHGSRDDYLVSIGRGQQTHG